MYNKVLFQKVINHCGLTECDPVSDEGIEEAQEQLGVRFPYDYISFIKEYGEGGIPGTYIYGIDGDYYTVVECTKEYRERFEIPCEYIAVINGNDEEREWIICLDTSRMKNGLCPAVCFDCKTYKVTDYATNFDDVVDKEIIRLYLTRIKPYENDNTVKRFLPDGMGYKSVWMLIKGSNQDIIADKLLSGEKIIKEYKAGVSEIYNSDNKALVTADYQGNNYVIMALTDAYFNQMWIEKNCTEFPECYVFLTERVSETHGFLKAVKGEVVRYYYQDEENIIDIGEPTIEEQINEIVLPHDLSEYWENLKKRTKTIMDEEVIITLGLTAGGVKEYTYADVIVGELIN